jgi:AcrR family transcriptional regulator
MSYQGAIVVNGVNYGNRLPRGRHGIPQELVIANQRERMLSAAATIFAERGYAAMSVSDVIKRAGVSRATFYQLFGNKLECLLAAQERALDGLQELIAAACRSQQDWPRGVAAAVGALLDFTARFPGDARLILASSHALSEPELAREGVAVHEQMGELLGESAARCPSARSPDGLSQRAAVGAAMSLLGSCLAADEIAAIPELKPDLVQIILAPYLGDNEAKRVATAA